MLGLVTLGSREPRPQPGLLNRGAPTTTRAGRGRSGSLATVPGLGDLLPSEAS